MLEAIFGNKKEMFDMVVYWDDNVSMNDLMDDLNRIGQYICMHDAFEKGSRITTVRNGSVNDTLYKTAELYVDKNTMKNIENDLKENKFKAVKFVKTTVG